MNTLSPWMGHHLKLNRMYATAAGGSSCFPSVNRLLREYGIAYETIKHIGHGPHGRVLKGDVLSYIKSQQLQPKTMHQMNTTSNSHLDKKESEQVLETPLYIIEPTNKMRRAIAERLTYSKTTVPHEYCTTKFEIDSLLVVRHKLNKIIDEQSKISFNDLLIRAAALTFLKVPEANTQWNIQKQEIIKLNTIDISIAVALDSGLITPIITNANHKGLIQISQEAKDLISRARKNSLQPHEFEGGTFSISNLGMFGISEFSAVINPPQSMILAISGPSLNVIIDNETKQPKTVTNLGATLSYDIRVVESKTASLWLSSFGHFMSCPNQWILY